MSGIDHFNLIGPIYDLIFGRKKDYEIIKRAEVGQDDRLLDVGGGTGRVTVLFKSITTNIVIVDSARKMLQQADERGIACVQSVSENLPFAEMSFDRIIMVDALHHVKDQNKTLCEMWRLLATGGRIVIEEGDIKNWLVKLVALGEKILFMRSHFLQANQIEAMCHFDETADIDLSHKKGVVWIIISKRKFH
jgi:ubiquinone/menaquinone biosynthesis C-methylase UbiE